MFIDLSTAPPSNSYLEKEEIDKSEVYYPLKLFICQNCYLLQIEEYKEAGEIFNGNYAYFSSYSKSWLSHAKNYVDLVTGRYGFNHQSFVVEIASNDGYLLQYFKEKGIPQLGIEPSYSVAKVALEKGIDTIVDFFGIKLAKSLISEEKGADLIIGNNVFAHVPHINDFAAGLKILLNPKGMISLEFPHLLNLIEENQFDTIYHEHYSYFSCYTAKLVLNHHGLDVFHVETIPTHGGSLRIFCKHKEDQSKKISPSVNKIIDREKSLGMQTLNYYSGFQRNIDRVKYELLTFLLEQKNENNLVVGYGAAAKGNTLLNYCGIKNDLIHFVADASPFKQGKYLPGSHIPIVQEKWIKEKKPEFVLIFPWNIKKEIIKQLNYIREWGGKFVTAIPGLKII